MALIRKNLAGEEDLSFDTNRNNETYTIVNSKGQLEVRTKINDVSIPVTLDAAWKDNSVVHDYILDLVELLEKVERNEIYGASTLAFGAAKVDYLQVNSNLANLSATPTGDVAVFAVSGSVQLSPEDFTINGLILTFVDGVFPDGSKIVVTYSINQFSIPSEGSESETEERLDVIEAEQIVQNARMDTTDVEQGVQDSDIADRSKWIYPAKALGSQWFKNEWTRSNGWTMMANKDTTDRPDPVPTGPEVELYTGEMPDTAELAKQVIFGNRYTLSVSTFLNAYRVNVIAGNYYEVSAVLDPLGTPQYKPLLEFEAASTGWTTINVSPSIAFAGIVLDLVVKVREPDPSPTTFTGDWAYNTPNNDTPPISGQVTQSNTEPALMNIHYTDNLAADYQTELQALVVGDIIEFLGSRYSIQSNTDNGTYATFTVAPSVQSTPDGVTSFIFETTTSTPITYGEDLAYWNTNPNIVGLLAVDGAYEDAIISENAYGTDLVLQEGLASEDWDIVTPDTSGGAGGGVGGGGSGGGGILPTSENVQSGDYTILVADITNRVIYDGSADSVFTLDVALLVNSVNQISFSNRGTGRLQIIVSDTGTMTFDDSARTDFFLWAGDGILTINGDTATNANRVAG